ncbi:C39 family peptidase [Oscillochloris sp. ZM17-4]|uniref:C39 family peptidase n=1 Tax=Oscillochloris sp. ZM17-4 TaxID=2866714 RepID=UPI001C729DA4|nr:C39 family peptidase [Oscillochloris sp. ZM17-4]MBX0328932.1 C39 family peptidase [Oscillochloris sp. ZM17-4]
MTPFPHAFVRYDAEAIAGWPREAPRPDDDPQARVALLGPELAAGGAAEAIPSWGADTPPGSWVEIQLRARSAGRWSRFYRLAAWDSAPAGSRRTSFPSQRDDDGRVATDTLLPAAPADAIQARVLLCAAPGADMPELESLALCLTGGWELGVGGWENDVPTPNSQLLIPSYYSQYLSFPGGEGWCSPTSLAMALAYWRERTGDDRLAPFGDASCVPDLVAPMVFDPEWEGTGNWIFNTAYAASLGLTAYVTRMHSLGQVARWTEAGVPVVCSLAWQPGELDGAPGATAGHLNLIVGFEEGHVLVAEPASRDMGQILRRYRADQLYDCWQRSSGGAVYLLHPPGHPRPAPGSGDGWA